MVIYITLIALHNMATKPTVHRGLTNTGTKALVIKHFIPRYVVYRIACKYLFMKNLLGK